MLVWLTRESSHDPTMLPLLAWFDDIDLECFKTARDDTYTRANYLLGLERFERAAYGEAIYFFARVSSGNAASSYAAECMRIIDAKNQTTIATR